VVADNSQKVTFTPKPEQIKFAEIWLDYTQKKTLDQVGDDIGVTRKTIWQWHQDPNFVEWINKQGFEILKSSLNLVYRALVRRAAGGDVQAIKLYLENIGEFVEKQEMTIGWKE